MARKKGKTSFLIHYDFEDVLKKLNDKEYREMIEAMFTYSKTKEIPQFSSRLLELCFLSIKSTMDDDIAAYEEVCNRNKRNVENRWGKTSENDTNVYDCIPNDTTVYDRIPNVPLDTTVYDSIPLDTKNTDNDKDKDINVCINNNSLTNDDFKCHLGSTEKNESCYDCMKKNICPLKESSQFLLVHPKGFDDWSKERDDILKTAVEKKKSKKPPDELFDYNWIDDDG